MKPANFLLLLIALFVCLQTASAQYCSTSNTFGDYRSVGGVVTTGGITNINNGPATNLSGVNGGGQPSYRDYTSHKVSQVQGGTINMQLWTTQYLQGGGSYSQSYDQYYYVWVDWNNDFDFTDPGEYMNINPASVLPAVTPLFINLNATGNGSFVVPATASIGNKRMRIRSNEVSYGATLPNGPGLSTCGSIGNRGETEDYTLEVLGGSCNTVPGTIASSAGNYACVSGGTTLSLTGHTGTSITYQWRSSTDGVNWSNVGTNAATYNTGTRTATTYYKVIMTCLINNAKDSTPVYTFSIHPNVTASVTIASDALPLTCAGTPVNFSAITANSGTTPVFQWKKNGSNVGTNNSTYTDNTLVSTDIITVEMQSSMMCATPVPAVSNSISIPITPTVLPTVTVSTPQTNNICAGTSVTFTSNITNEGTFPSYQWKINGNGVGMNIPAYTTASLADGDIITLDLTSNAICASPAVVTSAPITMIVNPMLTPVVNIAQDPSGSICLGTLVEFTAVPIHGGTSPQYTWLKNGSIVASGVTYTDNTLLNGDIIKCIMLSNERCLNISTVDGTNGAISISQSLYPKITITASAQGIFMPYQPITLKAIVSDAGNDAMVYWQRNGETTPFATGYSVTTTALVPGDSVSGIVQSKYACAMPNLVKSDKVGISSATGVNNINAKASKCALYPNPSTGHIVVKSNIQPGKRYSLQVVNTWGQVVYNDSIIADSNVLDHLIDLPQTIANGVYQFVIFSDGYREAIHFTISK